ncbi:MAG: hypothetical protein ABIH34_02120 [Nanoarchaeota archaeon]
MGGGLDTPLPECPNSVRNQVKTAEELAIMAALCPDGYVVEMLSAYTPFSFREQVRQQWKHGTVINDAVLSHVGTLVVKEVGEDGVKGDFTLAPSDRDLSSYRNKSHETTVDYRTHNMIDFNGKKGSGLTFLVHRRKPSVW